MEKDKYYDKAYEQFQNGNYDQALENMKLSQTVSEDERKKFINQCLSFITQQYIYLIHEAINNRDYTEANQLKGMYLHLYGENKEIASIGIPTDGQSNSTSQNSPTTQMPESQVSRETERTAAEVNNASPRPTVTFVQSTSPDNSNKNIIKWSVIGVIAAVLIIALIIAVSSKSNESGQVSALGKSVHQLKTLRIMIIQLQNHQVTSLLLRIRQLMKETRVMNHLPRVTSRPKTVIVQMKIITIQK